jgi:hypothetical protein
MSTAQGQASCEVVTLLHYNFTGLYNTCKVKKLHEIIKESSLTDSEMYSCSEIRIERYNNSNSEACRDTAQLLLNAYGKGQCKV